MALKVSLTPSISSNYSFGHRTLPFLPEVLARPLHWSLHMFSVLQVSYIEQIQIIANIQISFIGAAEDMAHSSLRFGIGRFTTEAEIDYVVERISAVVSNLRDMRQVLFFSLPSHAFLMQRVFALAPSGRWSRKASTSAPSTGLNTKGLPPRQHGCFFAYTESTRTLIPGNLNLNSDVYCFLLSIPYSTTYESMIKSCTRKASRQQSRKVSSISSFEVDNKLFIKVVPSTYIHPNPLHAIPNKPEYQRVPNL